MKGVLLPWLVRWACCAGPRDFCPALSALVSPVQNVFFPHRTLFHFICPHRPASLAGSRAVSPVFYCVSAEYSHSVSVHFKICIRQYSYTDLFHGRIRGQKGIIHDLFFRRNFLNDNRCTGPKNIIRECSNWHGMGGSIFLCWTNRNTACRKSVFSCSLCSKQNICFVNSYPSCR